MCVGCAAGASDALTLLLFTCIGETPVRFAVNEVVSLKGKRLEILPHFRCHPVPAAETD
jgi:hypothetical protein